MDVFGWVFLGLWWFRLLETKTTFCGYGHDRSDGERGKQNLLPFLLERRPLELLLLRDPRDPRWLGFVMVIGR